MYTAPMRTTVRLDDDIARAVEQMRREGVGTSEAVNTLARRGLAAHDRGAKPFKQTVSSMGRPRIPLDDIGAVLEAIEGESRRG